MSKQSVSDRCLDTLFCKLFIDESAALWLTAQSRRRERRDSAGRVRPNACGPGQYWRVALSSKLTKAKVFFSKKSLGLSVCTWKKSHQRGLKVAKYIAKVTLVTQELMAEGG